MRGTGELHCARLLGAWVSTTLLVATVGALIISGVLLHSSAIAP